MTKRTPVKIKMKVWIRKDRKFIVTESTSSRGVHMEFSRLELDLIQKNAILKQGEHLFTTEFPMKGLEEGMQFKDYLESLVEEELNSNK